MVQPNIWVNWSCAGIMFTFQMKRFVNVGGNVDIRVSTRWCYELVTIWFITFPLVDCCVVFLLYWPVMVSKCEGEVSSSFSQMLSYQFKLLHFWLPTHSSFFHGSQFFFVFNFIFYFSTTFPTTILPCHSPTWWFVPQLCSSLTLLFIQHEICFPTFPLLVPNGWLLLPLLSKERAYTRNVLGYHENNKNIFIQSKQQSTFVQCAYHDQEPCYLCMSTLL